MKGIKVMYLKQKMPDFVDHQNVLWSDRFGRICKARVCDSSSRREAEQKRRGRKESCVWRWEIGRRTSADRSAAFWNYFPLIQLFLHHYHCISGTGHF